MSSKFCVSVFASFSSVTVITLLATELLRDSRKEDCTNGNLKSYGFHLFPFVFEVNETVLLCGDEIDR